MKLALLLVAVIFGVPQFYNLADSNPRSEIELYNAKPDTLPLDYETLLEIASKSIEEANLAQLKLSTYVPQQSNSQHSQDIENIVPDLYIYSMTCLFTYKTMYDDSLDCKGMPIPALTIFGSQSLPIHGQ